MPILCFCASFLLVRYQSNSEFGYSKQLRDRTRLGLLHLDKQINEGALDERHFASRLRLNSWLTF